MKFHSRSRPRSRVRKSSRSRRDRDEIEKYCKVREFARNGVFGGFNIKKPSKFAFYVHKLQFKFTLYLKSCFLLNRQGAKTKLNLIKNCKNAKKGKKEAKTISRTRFFEKWHFEILENVTLELFSRSRNVIFRDRDRDRDSRTALHTIYIIPEPRPPRHRPRLPRTRPRGPHPRRRGHPPRILPTDPSLQQHDPGHEKGPLCGHGLCSRGKGRDGRDER